MDFVTFNGKNYPSFQAKGFAAQFAFPFANKLLSGTGLDIGCNQEKWKLPDRRGEHFRHVIGVDPAINPKFHATNVPVLPEGYDFIFSSHCLEHVRESWGHVLDYWFGNIKPGGILFLYLPGPGQEYWKNWNNTKHVHNFTPDMLKEYFATKDLAHSMVTGEDLNNSFYAVAWK